jgi:hypothetical protein
MTAIDRAAEALDANGVHCSRFDIVDTVLRAALTDPDDPDWLAREYVARLARESRETSCKRVCWHDEWLTMPDGSRDLVRAQVDAMRAAILGGAS